MKHILLALIAITTIACSESNKKKQVLVKADYDKYLSTSNTPGYNDAVNSVQFWSERLKPDSNGVGDLGPLAGAYSSLFSATGNIEYLKEAEKIIKKAIPLRDSANNGGSVRALARNYISQHRFKEAKAIMEKSYAGPVNKTESELLLFDIYMELGEYNKAKKMLIKFENDRAYAYLIRVAKWYDYKGDLDAAITNLEKAKTLAEQAGNVGLKIWTYTNLGDFYGHAGRIDDAYNHYLKSLELQADNAYAKKGLAWIAYAHEGDAAEANRILDSIMVNHKVADYYLLKAEMAENDGDMDAAKKYTNLFMQSVDKPEYGGMYNTYKIEVLANSNPQAALALAQKEVNNRATPETYDLLAYAQLKNGMAEEALKTNQTYVAGKTYEPVAALHSAMIYKATGLNDKIPSIKKELMQAEFEMGPLVMKEIQDL